MNQVQMCMFTNGEPYVAPIMKRFRYGIEPNHFLVETIASFQLGNGECNVIEVCFFLCRRSRSNETKQ